MPLLIDGRLDTGWFRRRFLLAKLFGQMVVPEPVYNYAKRISEITGLPLKEVLQSKPVRRMVERWTRYVVV